MLLGNIESYIGKQVEEKEEKDLMLDMRYISKSCALITESLQKGCDVMQLSNGDIVVTELKAVTFQYTWDEKRSKLIRTQYGNKPKQTRPRKAKANQVAEEKFKKIEELA